MLHFERWKILAILGTVLLGLLFGAPNFISKEQLKALPDWLPKRQMPLGLDLRGGAHLLMKMDTDALRKDWLDTIREDARRSMREAKIGVTGLGASGGVVQVRLNKPEEIDKAITELKKLIEPIGNVLLGTTANSIEVEKGTEPGVIQLKPTEKGFDQRIQSAITTSIETINRRINALGTAESTVVRQGRDRILVQYPGIGAGQVISDEKDPCDIVSKAPEDGSAGPGIKTIDDLKRLIGCTAKLAFHEVHSTVSVLEATEGRIPPGFKVYPSKDTEGAAEYLLKEVPLLTGEDLVDAQAGFDQQNNQPIINFRFDHKGATIFGKYTREHVNEPFAIVLDGKVISAPNIREPILGGSGQISGSFTTQTANDLSIQLRSGALPAKLAIAEERTVGPSLGADSIEAGKVAGLLGLGATALMTIFAYGTFGVYAVLGLIVHGILILALMSIVGTTLTLPGIAGFVLTIAMAVDANVLIYERIREELRAGRSPISAIDAGFSRAFVTILDSQLTTLAAALIMFWLGSGPIRGFAVTLSLGIITSVFAAVTITRLLVAMWLRNTKAKLRPADVPI